VAEAKKFRGIRGVRDILPPESALWNRVEQTAREVLESYNFREIRLPIFEETELFARSIGADTDVVSKEMYTFEDPALPGLENDREELLAADIMDADRLINFSADLDVLVHRLKRAQADEELDEESRSRVKQLAELRSRYDFDVLIRGLPQTFDDLYNAIREAKRLAENIDLGKRLTLRPEATASVVRAYIERGMQTWPSPVKLYYMGPMFRRERPQKGRYRQFYQIGAELLGSNIPNYTADAEVIEMVVSLFNRCGLTEHSLYINSIGCKECRPRYVELLRNELEKIKDKFGPDSQRRIQANPLRVLDSKVPEEQEAIESLPTILNHLCEPCHDDFEGLKKALERRRIAFKVNPRLVRGLDYYVRTTFEITAPGLGAQDAVCGGGRYDGLVELIGGSKFREVKGVGFAVGEDRLVDALQSSGVSAPARADVLVAWKDEASRAHADSIARLLRDMGLAVEVPLKPMAPGEGLGFAKRLGIPIGIVIGPDEVSAGAFGMRLLAEADQASLNRSQIQERDLRLLLQFRVLLERELQQIAILNGVEHKNIPPTRLAQKLIEAGALSGDLKLLISIAMDTFSKLVHGQKVQEDHLSEAVAASVRVLDELSSVSSKSRFRIG